MKWNKDENGGYCFEMVCYYCFECDVVWKDEICWVVILKGCWIVDVLFNGIVGFYLNEIYFSWVWFEVMVKVFFLVCVGGDEMMKIFVNMLLGETWMESGEVLDW